MQLTLRCPGTNGTPRDEVRDVLWRDGIKKLRADGYAEVCQIAEELSGNFESIVNSEGAIDVRIVDESFPADSRTGFLDRYQYLYDSGILL